MAVVGAFLGLKGGLKTLAVGFLPTFTIGPAVILVLDLRDVPQYQPLACYIFELPRRCP